MSYRTIIAYERQGKIIRIFFLLCAIVCGALGTVVLTTLGILPDFKIFLPDTLPENHYLSIIINQREFFPFYIHFLFLTCLAYLIFRSINLVYQRLSLLGVKKELEVSLKFSDKMRDLKANTDEEEVARFLYNFRRQLSSHGRYSVTKLISDTRRRLAAVFKTVSDLSSENILLINDTLASSDYSQTDYTYKFVRFLIRLAILLGIIGTVAGLAILVYSIVTGNSEINVLSDHLVENLEIAGYSLVVGVCLLALSALSKHLDESCLLLLDNFLIAEIVQKVPFKSTDSLILLRTYMRTLRNFEKSVEDQLNRLNQRIDHLTKTLKQ